MLDAQVGHVGAVWSHINRPVCSPWICQNAARLSTWQPSSVPDTVAIAAVPACLPWQICQSRVSELSGNASSFGRYAELTARLDEAHGGWKLEVHVEEGSLDGGAEGQGSFCLFCSSP